jgi:hypothetical protein
MFDNAKIFFGASHQSSIYWNVSDLIINPKEVGSGQTFVQGNTIATGTLATRNATAWSGYAVCYLGDGTLGHCTSIVGVGGTCTCANN